MLQKFPILIGLFYFRFGPYSRCAVSQEKFNSLTLLSRQICNEIKQVH